MEPIAIDAISNRAQEDKCSSEGTTGALPLIRFFNYFFFYRGTAFK